MKRLLINYIALLFSLGCMAYSEGQATTLVSNFYDKLNIIANEQYKQLKRNKGDELTDAMVTAQEDFCQIFHSRLISMPNDFFYFLKVEDFSNVNTFPSRPKEMAEDYFNGDIYPLRLKEMVKYLYELKISYNSPYQINIYSIDSVLGKNTGDFYMVKLIKEITFGEKTVSFDEKITIHASSNKIVKIVNTAIDSIEVNENEEEEQQAIVRRLVERVKNCLSQLNKSSLSDEQKKVCIEQLKESILCNEKDGNFRTNVLVGKSEKMISLNDYIKSLPIESKQRILSMDTYNPYRFYKDIDGIYNVWAYVYTFIFKPNSEIGYEVRRKPKDIHYETRQKPYQKLSLPDGTNIKIIKYLIGDIAIADN